VSNDPYWPRFLTPRAYDPHEHEDYLQRAAYAYPSIVKERMDRRLELAGLYGPEPLDVDTACEWAERLAAEVLR
jgi:hypothetical protein